MKKLRKIKNNNYSIGGMIRELFTGANLLNNAVNATSAISGIAGGLIPSSGDAKLDAITGGISTGLEAVGSAFGPIGGAIGKAAGLLTKGIGAMVGSKGSVNTDTGELTEGKGIRGRRNRNNLYAQYRRVNQGLSDVQLTSALQLEWAEEHGDNDFALAADGGIIPTTLAYLDDGELGRTPDGKMFEVPEEGKPTDSNLVKVPVGTLILSDKIKVPGTNKTFAEKGKEIMKTNKYKGNDKYAENSKKLNDRNALIAYDNLLALQESLKLSKDKQSKVRKYDLGTSGVGRVRYNTSKAINNPDSSKSTSNFDFSGLVGNLAGLAGPISNIASATPEKARVFTYTPQFAPTEYDITPMLREIDLSNAITRYNVNQAGGAGTGANLAQAIQGQVARDRSIAQAYNMKNNIENERRARNTGIYNDWARYNTEAFHRGYVEDAQNRAAADLIRRTAVRDLGTALQTMSRDRRLARRDLATLAAMEPFLQYGMTGEQYLKLMNLLR